MNVRQEITTCWKCGGPAKARRVYGNEYDLDKGAFLGWTCGCQKRNRCGEGEHVLHISRAEAINGWNAYTARRGVRATALIYALELFDESKLVCIYGSKEIVPKIRAALVEILEEEKT